jgi:hypothetical protein
MKKEIIYRPVPKSRIATFDTFSIWLKKHHVPALLEFDVTESRRKLQESRRGGVNISFNGWFIHRSVHPVSFGIGSVIKKPVVIDNEVRIRDILNMTVLVDHDLTDGAPMVRMLKDLTNYIEAGAFTGHSAHK